MADLTCPKCEGPATDYIGAPELRWCIRAVCATEDCPGERRKGERRAGGRLLESVGEPPPEMLPLLRAAAANRSTSTSITEDAIQPAVDFVMGEGVDPAFLDYHEIQRAERARFREAVERKREELKLAPLDISAHDMAVRIHNEAIDTFADAVLREAGLGEER